MHGDLNNERELLARVVNGDEAAFTILFRQHHRKIYTVALMLTQSPVLAEELVQEVFLKVWVKREQLSLVDNFESWLFIVARNDAYKALRKSARLRGLLQEFGDTPPFTHETDELVQYRNFLELLGKAVNRLPPRQQMVWRLSKEEGLKREEIARQMQIRPDTVKEHLALAVKSIRSYLQGRDPLVLGTEILFIWCLAAQY